MRLKFIQCGMYGWCMEVLWTGLNSLIHHIPISKTLLRPKLIERESTARCAHRD